MRKTKLTVALVCTLLASMTLPSCIGTFTLTNKLLTWNRQISNKFVNELVFFAFWVLPVYEVSALADVIVLNSIEFWSGTNPVAAKGQYRVKGNDAEYLVNNDRTGYTIESLADGSTVRLDFNSEDRSWAVSLPDGSSRVIFSFVDDEHIALPAPGNEEPVVVELTQSGVLDYQHIALATAYAAR